MCGILGIASRERIEHRDWLASGLNTLLHRGPDGSGEWWDSTGRIGLAHRRLAIIDLSDEARQPMQAESERLTIVFNGEIYNFLDLRRELEEKGAVFHTASDTEVVLAAYREWGTDCLSRLNGMFAFALYDSLSEQVFLARDRAGEKPLFYTHDGKTLRFSSELKALMADPSFSRRVSFQALDIYLAQGFIPGDGCILAGARKLPPAHALLFNLRNGECRSWRYWRLPGLEAPKGTKKTDDAALLDELELLLEDAVRRQLVADVPVGVLLSGGVDSSLVTAMAARSRSNVKTFTIRFPGHGKYDETEHARLIARHFGTEHTELEAESSTVDLLPLLARQYDEPIIDSSMIPTYLVSQLIRRHCTVALGGDGGDELFGGYGHYNRLLWLQRRSGQIPLPVRRMVAAGAEFFLPSGFKGRNWAQALATDMTIGVPLVAGYFDARTRKRLLAERSSKIGSAEALHEACMPRASDLLDRATRMDFENYLPEDILVKVDRASMLSSLEVRAPMLDYRLIEFAFGKVPSHLKATSGSRKILLKKLAARVLPPEFDQQRKQGFSIPISSWLRSGPWLEYFREVLLDSGQTLFDHGCISLLFEGQGKGYNNGERLFGLVMFELWRRQYQIELGEGQ
jgi:asparagine synthase (glutamine-hydrolysing)